MLYFFLTKNQKKNFHFSYWKRYFEILGLFEKKIFFNFLLSKKKKKNFHFSARYRYFEILGLFEKKNFFSIWYWSKLKKKFPYIGSRALFCYFRPLKNFFFLILYFFLSKNQKKNFHFSARERYFEIKGLFEKKFFLILLLAKNKKKNFSISRL